MVQDETHKFNRSRNIDTSWELIHTQNYAMGQLKHSKHTSTSLKQKAQQTTAKTAQYEAHNRVEDTLLYNEF